MFLKMVITCVKYIYLSQTDIAEKIQRKREIQKNVSNQRDMLLNF